MKVHLSVAMVGFVVFCLAFMTLERPNSEYQLARSDAANVYGTWTGIAVDVTPEVHNGYRDWGIVNCEKKEDPAECNWCIGANYQPACQGATVCATKVKHIILGDPSGGDLQADPNPTNTYCSKKLCNGVNTYCGQGVVIGYICG